MLPVNCGSCPFARPLDGNRHVCTNSATAQDVVRSHWEPKTDCLDEIAQVKTGYQVEKVGLLYEGDDCVGREDREPPESKYPWLRVGYDPNLNEF